MKSGAERLAEADAALAEANAAIREAREAEAEAELQAVYARVREGRAQTAEIKAMPRREQVLAAQQRPAPEEVEVDPAPYSWRPSRPRHFYELIRTAAATVQVLVGLAILVRVYGLA